MKLEIFEINQITTLELLIKDTYNNLCQIEIIQLANFQ